MIDGPLPVARGERMLQRWTLAGHPVTFSWIEVLLALWKACWLPGYLIGQDAFTVSAGYLAGSFGGGSHATACVAYAIGLVGLTHVAIMLGAWLGLTRPPRTLRLLCNALAATIFGYMAGISIGLDAYTTAGPYAVFTLIALGNLQRAVRNGRGYRK